MSKRSLKWFGIFCAALCGAVVLLFGVRAQSGAMPEQRPEPVSLGVYAGDASALVYLASEKEIFAGNGLDVALVEFASGKAAADALLAGKVGVSTSSDSVFVSNVFERTDLRLLASISTGETNELIARLDRGIRQPGDLAGKTIGVTRRSAGEFYLGSFLLSNGLSLDQVHIVDVKTSEMSRVLSDGEVDAVITWNPVAYEIKTELADRVTTWNAQGSLEFQFLLLSTQPWVESNPRVARKLLKSLVEAQMFLQSHPAEARTSIQQRFGYTPEYTRYSWEHHRFDVSLSQKLLVTLEDQARWRIANRLTAATAVPDYLDQFAIEPLASVRPAAVSLIR